MIESGTMPKRDKVLPRQHVTRRRLARWQQERRKRRFYVSAGIAIIAVVIGTIIYGVYDTNISMANKWVTTVGGTRFVGTDYADALHLCQLGFYGNASDPREAPIIVIEQNELVKQRTAELHIYVNDSEIDDLMRTAVQGNATLNDDEFQQAYQELLDSMELTDKQFAVIMENSLLQQKLYEYLLADVPDAGENVSQIYLEILTVNESQLSDVQARVDGGEHLADLQGNYTYNEIGWMPRGAFQLPTGIEEVAFNLSVGNVSDPLPIGNGFYYLVEVTDKGERPIDEALREQLKYNLLPRWMAEEHEGKVERNPDLNLDKMYDWALAKIGG